MTKLFSMKTLAFAGAAAFALTLAAAPQAQAAEESKPAIIVDATNDYYSYINSYGYSQCIVPSSAVTIVDGKAQVYYCAVNTGKEAKKYTAILCAYHELDPNDEDSGDQELYTHYKLDSKISYYRITFPAGMYAKGKAKDIYIALDAAGTINEKLEYQATPKVKIAFKYTASGPAIDTTKFKINGTAASGSSGGYIDVTGKYSGMWAGISLKDLFGTNEDAKESQDSFSTNLQRIVDAGGEEVYVNYTWQSETANTYPQPDADKLKERFISVGTAKAKIAGKAKAPKLSLKLALVKDLAFKPKNQEYRVYPEDKSDVGVKWTEYSTPITSLETLFGKDHVTQDKTTNEYTLNDNMKLQVRTAAKGNKAASNITVTTVYKSTEAPVALVNATVSNKMSSGNKPTTGASIKFDTKGLTLSQAASVSNSAIVTLQYKTTGANKWTDVKKDTVEFKNNKIPKEIYIRVKGTDENTKSGKESALEAPGKALIIELDTTDPENNSKYSYKDSDTKKTKKEIEEANKK